MEVFGMCFVWYMQVFTDPRLSGTKKDLHLLSAMHFKYLLIFVVHIVHSKHKVICSWKFEKGIKQGQSRRRVYDKLFFSL